MDTEIGVAADGRDGKHVEREHHAEKTRRVQIAPVHLSDRIEHRHDGEIPQQREKRAAVCLGARGELPLVKLRRVTAPLFAQGNNHDPNDDRNGHADGSTQKSSHVVHNSASFSVQAQCSTCHS